MTKLRNPRRIFSQYTDYGNLAAAIAILNNNEYKITYYEVVSTTSGTITPPTGATFNDDEFGDAGNAILSTLATSGKPNFQTPLDGSGNPVTVSLNTTTGGWITSGAYVDPDVAIIYSIKIRAVDYQNLTYDNIIEYEEINQPISLNPEEVVITDASGNLDTLSLGASQSIRRNAANNAFEAYTGLTSSDIGVTVQAYNANTTLLGNTTTGSGSIVLATSPTFGTSITTPLVIGGTSANQVLTFQNTTGTTTSAGTAYSFKAGNLGTDLLTLNIRNFTFTPFDTTAGAITPFAFTTPTNTGQTAGTNIPNFRVNGSTKTWSAGALATQYFNYFTANTVAFASASTATNVYNLFVEAPIQGTNATITNNYAAGFGGNVNIIGDPYINGVAPTGSGSIVLATSPTLTTPTIGQINGVANSLAINGRTTITEGSIDVKIGERSTGNACIWFNQSSPDGLNFNFGGSATGATIINGSGTAGTVDIRSLGSNVFILKGSSSSGVTHSFDFIGLSKTNQTASDSNIIRVSPSTTEFTTGSAISLVRTSYFRSGTYTATSATQTVTDLVNGYFESNTAGANLTATNNWALWSNGNSKTVGNHNITGSLVLGSATLTGGNSGVAAIVDDNYFSITFNAGTQGSTMHNPADGATVYIGNTLYLPNGNATHGVITIPVDAVLIGYNINIVCAGVVGSGESASFFARVNNASDITLSTSITYNSGTAYQQFESMALNTNINANDKINIKVVYPVFATNPTAVFTGVTLWFKRR